MMPPFGDEASTTVATGVTGKVEVAPVTAGTFRNSSDDDDDAVVGGGTCVAGLTRAETDEVAENAPADPGAFEMDAVRLNCGVGS